MWFVRQVWLVVGVVFFCRQESQGAFTVVNKALRANDLHVKSMQRRDRQSCAKEVARITLCELGV